MAIPGGGITPTPIIGDFLPPENEPYQPLYQKVWGGTAIGDGADGRMVKYWEVFYEDCVIKVRPEGGAVEFTYPDTGKLPGVQSCSLAFDGNMFPVIAFHDMCNSANIYYYNGNMAAFTTLSITATSCRIAVDDLRDFATAQSDIIFAYTNDLGELYYRQQRENYSVPRFVGTASTTTVILKKVGLSTLNRLQFFAESIIQP